MSLRDVSGLDQAEMRSLLGSRILSSQLTLLEGVLNSNAVQKKIRNDCPFPGTSGFALGHAVFVMVKEDGQV